MKTHIIHRIYAKRNIISHTDKERRHQGLRAIVPPILLPALLVCHKHRRQLGGGGRNRRRAVLYHLEGKGEAEHLPLCQELSLHRSLERMPAAPTAKAEGRRATKEDVASHTRLHFQPGGRGRI